MAGIQIQGGGMQELPTILKDWISWQEAEAPVWESYGGDGGGMFQTYAGRDAGYGFTAAGNPNDPFWSSPFLRNTNNFEWSFDPQTGAPSVRVKSGDKTGTTVRYVQDGAGNWVPDYGTQTNAYWDTNRNDDFYKGVGMVAGAALGGNVLAASGGLGAAAQGAWQGGLSAAEAAALGIGAGAAAPFEAGFVGSAASPVAAGATGSELALSGAIPELAGWGTASGIPLGAGGGALPALGELAPALAGGWTGAGGAAVSASTIMDMVQKYGPKVLEAFTGSKDMGSLINSVGSFINASQDEKYTDRLLANRIENAQKMFDFGQQFKGMYDPRGATIDNGIATATVDPVTGRATSTLNAPFQQAQDQYLGAANTMFGQLKDFNPQTFAQDRYNSAQALLAAGDTTAEQGLMQQLYNKGGYGLSVNTPAAATPGAMPGSVQAGQGTVGVNPLLSSFLNERNARNANMSYRSLSEGESYLDNLIRRQKGMFDSGLGIAREGASAIAPAINLGSSLTNDWRKAADFQYGLGKDYYGEIGSANRDAMYADALRRSGMVGGAFNMPTGGGGGGTDWGKVVQGGGDIIRMIGSWF